MTPYFPYLQPIELYWLKGKGNVSHNYYFVRRVKSTVYDLRYGWYGNTHFTLSGKMDLSVPEDKYPDFIIEVKKVECFTLIKKSIRCANNGVAAILSIYSPVDRDLHIDAEYRPTNVPATAIPIDTICQYRPEYIIR